MSSQRAIKAEEGASLSEKETTVLCLVAKGMTTKEIARLTGASYHTVNDHLKSIYIRAGVGSRVEAAVWAAKKGIV